MKNVICKLGFISLILIALAVGFLLAKMFTVPGVTVSKDINPLHGISILSSVFVAIYVALMLDKHKESKKIKRDLIFKHIDDLCHSIDVINAVLEKDEIQLSNITMSLKKIWLKYNSLKKILVLAAIPHDGLEKKFERFFKDLKILLTNVPIRVIDGEPPSIKCSKGVLRYTMGRTTEIETTIISLGHLAVELQFDIAKS